MILNQKTTVLTTALCALSLATISAQAAPVHHSLLGKLFHHKPAASKPMAHHSLLPFHKPMAHHGVLPFHKSGNSIGSGGYAGGTIGSGGYVAGGRSHVNLSKHGTTATSGQIIGNKHSHVFHMPGQPGALPAPQNRVYFSSAAAAEHAGYHAMGSMHKSASHPMKHMTMKHK